MGLGLWIKLKTRRVSFKGLGTVRPTLGSTPRFSKRKTEQACMRFKVVCVCGTGSRT